MIVVLASRVRLSFLVTRATNVSWIPNSAANLVQKLQARLTVLVVDNSRYNTFIPCSEMKILSEPWPNQFYEKNFTSQSGCSSLLSKEVSLRLNQFMTSSKNLQYYMQQTNTKFIFRTQNSFFLSTREIPVQI